MKILISKTGLTWDLGKVFRWIGVISYKAGFHTWLFYKHQGGNYFASKYFKLGR